MMISIVTATIEGVTSCAPAILGLGAVFRLAFLLAEAGIAGARLLHFLCRLGLAQKLFLSVLNLPYGGTFLEKFSNVVSNNNILLYRLLLYYRFNTFTLFRP